MTWALVFLGGMAGTLLRHLTNTAIRHPRFPWSTFAANVTGSLALGLLTGITLTDDPLRLLIGTGLCGALTTYSTLSYETLRLAETGFPRQAAANVVGTVLAGAGALWLGISL
jgi:fluoride exporter